jgi:hypothetical protein
LEFYSNYSDRKAITPEDLADASAAVGDHQAAMTQLERAANAKAALLPYMLADPIFKPLHGEARFVALRARLNLPPTATN